MRGRDGKVLHYFNNIKIDGTEARDKPGNLWDKEVFKCDETFNGDYNNIHFWWEGRIATPIQADENSKNNNVTVATAEKGDGLKISTLNLIDNNIILYEL